MAKEISEKELKGFLAKPWITVVEAGLIFGMSRSNAYFAVKNNQIPSIRIGRRVKVPTAAIREMLNPKTVAGGAK